MIPNIEGIVNHTFSKRIGDLIFTKVKGFAAKAASENRRMTSVSQSTLDCNLGLLSKPRLNASTDFFIQTRKNILKVVLTFSHLEKQG